VQTGLMNVRFEGNGHDAAVARCLLFLYPPSAFSRSNAASCLDT